MHKEREGDGFSSDRVVLFRTSDLNVLEIARLSMSCLLNVKPLTWNPSPLPPPAALCAVICASQNFEGCVSGTFLGKRFLISMQWNLAKSFLERQNVYIKTGQSVNLFLYFFFTIAVIIKKRKVA